ncbi:MAG: hypothetical protein HY649_07140 [Acidobacteria bacterium]|nr:hypothetical protein [Acidobacteriota bacterium]
MDNPPSRFSRFFRVGKLPPEELQRLLGRLTTSDPRVIVGARIGEDAAVIEMGDRYLVAKTDPISFATEKIGWYCVHINANDVAVTGAKPKWFLAAVLLPEEGTDARLVQEIFTDITAACQELGVTLCGGHTEITHGLDRPIVVGQMLGEVAKEGLLRKESLEPGDRLVLTRGVAIEGTAVIAREKPDELAGEVADAVIEQASRLLFEPGISVVEAAQVAAATGAAKAMHDPTEAGALAGLLEMAVAAGLGIRVFADHIPVLPETQQICAALDLDPLALLASGALLIGVSAEGTKVVRQALETRGIPSAVVAEMRPAQEGYEVERGGKMEELVFPERDELAKLF